MKEDNLQLWREILDRIPMGIFISSPDGKIRFINKAAIRLLGYPSIEDFRAHVRNIMEIYANQSDRDRIFTSMLTGDDRNQRALVPCRKKTGDIFYADIQLRAMINEDGSVESFEGFFTDASDRKRTRDALTKSEQDYRQLVESAPVGIYRIDPEGRFLMANPALARSIGYESVSEFLREVPNVTRLYSDPKSRPETVGNAIRQGNSYRQDIDFIRKDGRRITLRCQGRFVRDSLGLILYSEGFAEDVTQQIETLKALEETGERFRNLVEITSEGVWETDVQFQYTYVSPRLCRLRGYPRHEILGRMPFDFMPPEEAERVQMMFEPIAANLQAFSFMENRNVTRNGRKIVLETSGVPCFDRYGRWIGYRGIDRDITERKALETALARSREKLEQRVEERTRELEQSTEKLAQQRKQLKDHRKTLKRMNRELIQSNRALNLMARKLGQSGVETEKRIALIIRSKVVPLVENLRRQSDSASQSSDLVTLAFYLKDLSSSLGAPLQLSVSLTPTEMKVASYILDGLSTLQIAQEMNVSVETVKSHRKNIRKKLGIRDSKANLRKQLQSRLV